MLGVSKTLGAEDSPAPKNLILELAGCALPINRLDPPPSHGTARRHAAKVGSAGRGVAAGADRRSGPGVGIKAVEQGPFSGVVEATDRSVRGSLVAAVSGGVH